MRVISCAKTVDAVLERHKTVTRRWGWRHAKPGMRLRVVDRLRYRASDPPQRTLAIVEVVGVSRVTYGDCFDAITERPRTVADDDVPYRMAFVSMDRIPYRLSHELAYEGFGHLGLHEFLVMLSSMSPPIRSSEDADRAVLTRIEWRYREDLFQLPLADGWLPPIDAMAALRPRDPDVRRRLLRGP